jgi:hypothetical protein
VRLRARGFLSGADHVNAGLREATTDVSQASRVAPGAGSALSVGLLYVYWSEGVHTRGQ